MDLHVIHTLPGRTRFAIPELQGNPSLAETIVSNLARLAHVQDVRADGRTGRVLVVHQGPRQEVDDVLLRCREGATPHRSITGRPPKPAVWKRAVDTDPEGRLSQPAESDMIAELSALRAAGLREPEVTARLEQYGPNVLPRSSASPWWITASRQLGDPMTVALLGVAGISLAIRRMMECASILSVIAINVTVSVIQEQKSHRESVALQNIGPVSATVVRDHRVRKISATEIVPGDLLLVEAGDRIAADGVFVEAHRLHLDESALTGESVPVQKLSWTSGTSTVPNACRGYLGTCVTTGRGRMLVVATGARTVMGVLSRTMEVDTDSASPLEVQLRRVGKALVYLVSAAGGLVVLLGFLRGQQTGHVLLTGLTMVASAIPEGLPVLITIALTAGVRRMGARSALIRKLSALETLGRTTVICSDKTGTLTCNEMSVQRISDGQIDYTVCRDAGVRNRIVGDDGETDGARLQAMMHCAVLCNDAMSSAVGDPTETALLALAASAAMDVPAVRAAHPRIRETPFASETRRMTVVCATPEGHRVYMKGAVEEVLARCVRDADGWMTPPRRQRIEARAIRMAEAGLRVLCLASGEMRMDALSALAAGVELPPVPEAWERELTFLGLVGMGDPPREHVQESLRTCRDAGIRVVMITGDHPETAQAIARQIGLVREGEPLRVVTGREMDIMNDDDLARCAVDTHIYARVDPRHKLSIVRAWKSLGHVVAMTGDGVNDAPAIRHADVGIAMGRSGTDVAKEAALMTLVDDSFPTIVHAVKEGRFVRQRIRDALGYLLSGNLGEVLFVVTSVVLGSAAPLSPMQILTINLLTDSAPTLALLTTGQAADAPLTDGARWKRTVTMRALQIGLSAIASSALGRRAYGPQTGRTMAMVTLIAGQLLQMEDWRAGGVRTSGLSRRRGLSLTFWGSSAAVLCALYVPFFRRITQSVALSPKALAWSIGTSALSRIPLHREGVR